MVTHRSAVLVICLSLVLMASGSALAQQSLQLPTVVTEGVGYVVLPADHIVVTLSVETTDLRAADAYARNSEISRSIREALEAEQPEGLAITIGGISLWQQRSATLYGSYRATSTVSIRLAHEADVGKVIDTAMQLGATAVQSVRFHASSLESAARTALTLAVEDAMAKAEAIAKATESRIVTIRRVHDTNDVRIYNPSDPVLVEGGKADPTPYQVAVERGEILVQVTVTMEFEVAPRN